MTRFLRPFSLALGGARGQTLPLGFVDEVLAAGLDKPIGVDLLSDSPQFPQHRRSKSGLANLADARVGPDGALYWVNLPTSGAGSLHRIRPVGRQLAVVSGDGQAGNAGQPLAAPLVVQLTSASGAPVPGVPVVYSVIGGGGAPAPPTATTDAAGNASAALTIGTIPVGVDVVVSATAAEAPAVLFTAIWRGLAASVDAPSGTLALTAWHSQTSSPLTLAVDVPPPSPVPTPWGPVWTSVLAPASTAVVLDGLGLRGQPDPAIATGPTIPTWSLVVPGLPALGGPILTFQAYAIDTARLPGEDAVMISNPVVLQLP